MKLHRADNKPDWERVSAKKRTYWQRLAAQTKGLVTPGNIITATGLLLVLIGCVLVAQEHYLGGFVTLLIGRFADYADGLVAEHTQTKSALGALLDAAIDKLATFAIFITLIVSHIVPAWLALLTILVHVVILYPSSIGVKRGITIQPAITGKIGMALTWGGVLGYVAGFLFDGIPGALCRLLGFVLVLLGFALTTHAATTYFRKYLQAK